MNLSKLQQAAYCVLVESGEPLSSHALAKRAAAIISRRGHKPASARRISISLRLAPDVFRWTEDGWALVERRERQGAA